MNPKISELIKPINGQSVVLSTSADDIVTSRIMSAIAIGDYLYFASENLESYDKIAQLAQNPHVAVCFNNIQITGKASLVGLATDENTKEFLDAYKAVFPDTYYRFEGKEYLIYKVNIVTYKSSSLVDGKPEYSKFNF